MTILQAFILGIIQGLTEFLPVSSSAHLVITPFILGWKIPETQVFPFDVLVQLGTLTAVIIYFWKDLIEIARAWINGILTKHPFEDHMSRLGWYLIFATIPAGLVGFLIKDIVEAAFRSVAATACFLIVNALILFVAELLGKRTRGLAFMNTKDAFWIGIAQIISLFPGISRSGSTISAGLVRNLQRPAAARFSFLMSIPIMLAAGLYSLLDLFEIPRLASFLPNMAIGFITAGIVGFFSIHWLLKFIANRSFKLFSIYCGLIGIITLIIYYAR